MNDKHASVPAPEGLRALVKKWREIADAARVEPSMGGIYAAGARYNCADELDQALASSPGTRQE